MFDMGFDIFALVKPKTRADYEALSREGLAEIISVKNVINDCFHSLENEQREKQVKEEKAFKDRQYYAYGCIDMTVGEWVNFLGIPYTLFYSQVALCGWNIEEAIRRFVQGQQPE